MIKVLFFDMYQTLVDTGVDKGKETEENAHKAVFSSYLIKNGIQEASANNFQSTYEKLRSDFYLQHDKKTEHHDFKKLLGQTFKEFYNTDIDDKTLDELIWQYRILVRGTTKLYDGVKDTLEVLSKDYKVFLASYTQASFSLMELEELGVKDYFTGFVFSSDIGYRKTSDIFYKKCIEVSESEAGDCVMIGDSRLEDMYMAKKSGMKTVWIKNPVSINHPDLQEINPDAEIDIKDFYKLPEIVKNI